MHILQKMQDFIKFIKGLLRNCLNNTQRRIIDTRRIPQIKIGKGPSLLT